MLCSTINAVSNFPIINTIEVRFRDLDPLGHVNNAVYLTYAELGRIKYFDSVGSSVLSGNFVLARAETDFIRPVHLGESMEVRTRVTKLGRSSLTMLHEMWSEGQVASRMVGVAVWLENGSPARIPQALREAIGRLEQQPVEGI